MKKIALILAAAMLLFAFAGCSSQSTAGATAPEGTTDELMTKIYENVTVELPLMNIPVDFADEYALSAYTGAASADGMVEATASESMIGAQAYSVTLVRCDSAEKAAEVAQTMFDNIDTRKWICVEATEKMAVTCGDLAMFVMLNPEYGVTAQQIADAFTQVCGGTVDNVIQ